jgi:hypothetical protein
MTLKANLLMVLILIGGTVFSQNSVKPIQFPADTSDPLNANELSQLKEVYGDFLKDYLLDRPNQLRNMKFLLRSRIKIIRVPNKDLSGFQKLSDLPLFSNYNRNIKRPSEFDSATFNPLIYGFQWFSPNQQMFQIDNTDLLLQIIPQDVFSIKN